MQLDLSGLFFVEKPNASEVFFVFRKVFKNAVVWFLHRPLRILGVDVYLCSMLGSCGNWKKCNLSWQLVGMKPSPSECAAHVEIAKFWLLPHKSLVSRYSHCHNDIIYYILYIILYIILMTIVSSTEHLLLHFNFIKCMSTCLY